MILASSRSARLVLAAALVAAASGCTMTFDARALGVTATMAAPAAQPIAGDTFAVTTRAIHILWGAYPIKSPNLRSVLAGQLSGNQSIANLRISTHKSLSDLLVTGLTLGIVSPTAVKFEGVVVSAPAGGQ